MSTKIIVSYDGTNNENDAIAYGSLLARAGAEVSLGYVRHTDEAVSDQEAQEVVLDRAAALFAGTFAASHVVTNRSTPEGLRALAEQIGAQAIVFCSDSHTAHGHVTIGNSAQRLLDGGRFAIAIASAGLAERGPQAVHQIAVVEDPSDPSAGSTAQQLAEAFSANLITAGESHRADLLVVGSRPEASQGQVALSAATMNMIESKVAAVLVLPRGVSLHFGKPVGLSA
ncbi:MAG: hypothetical protein ACRDK2_02695 [Solirubrobacteraceae bacterium]